MIGGLTKWITTRHDVRRTVSPIASVLHAEGVTKRRGEHDVLKGVDVDVRRGEILTILGPNGAGKSTLMAILAGLLRPDTGVVQLDGENLTQLGARARARLGVALQRPGLTPRLTVREILTFFSLCYRGNRPIDDLLDRFGLAALQHRQIRRLSEGETHRVSLTFAFLKPFDVILLDEPTAGLDAEARRLVWQEIAQARARGAAVVWVTHLMDEAHQHSDRVLVLDAGRVVACDSPQALLDDGTLSMEDVFQRLTNRRES